ncbi:MAG: hypothetical protein ACJ76N_31560 [Thermoanaerobaculia bacterium]
MKKKARKLQLSRESIYYLGAVTGGVSTDPDACGYTSPMQCQLVPSVDYCGTNAVACATDATCAPSGQQFSC